MGDQGAQDEKAFEVALAQAAKQLSDQAADNLRTEQVAAAGDMARLADQLNGDLVAEILNEDQAITWFANQLASLIRSGPRPRDSRW